MMKLRGNASKYRRYLKSLEGVSYEKCSSRCLENEKCQSFVYSERTVSSYCDLKDENLTAKSAIKYESTTHFSAFKICGKGIKDNNCFINFNPILNLIIALIDLFDFFIFM